MGVNYFSAVEALPPLTQDSPYLKESLQSLSFFERITNISFKAKSALKVALHSGFPHYESKRLPSSERGQSHTDTHRLYGVHSGQAAAHAHIR
jgi:hypothetical protein